MSGDLLSQLLDHYGLSEFSALMSEDAFTLENLLQIKTESDFIGFFEHYDVQGFLLQNRFKTLIAAIPAIKRTNRVSGHGLGNEVRRLGHGFPGSGSQLVPFGGQGWNGQGGALAVGNQGMGLSPFAGAGGVFPMMGVAQQMGYNPLMNMNGISPMTPIGQYGMNGLNTMAMINKAAAQQTPTPKVPKKANKVVAPVSPDVDLKEEAKEDDDEFATEEARDGEQFASIKPWIGTVTATKPDNAPQNNPSPPTTKLEIDWIYGFKCRDVRQNIILDSRGRIVYSAASVLVAYDISSNTQQHYTGPTDEISCLTQSPVDPNLVAVGQCASLTDDKKTEDPFITVFDLSKNLSIRLPAKHKRNIATIAFSIDGTMIASNGTDDNFAIMVWDWKNKKLLAEDKAVNRTVILSLAWNTKVNSEFIGVGKGTVAFYQVSDSKIRSTQAKFDQGTKDTTFICASYTEKGTAVVGTKEGSVYYFVGNTCQKVFDRIQDGPIHTIFTCPEGALTSGDGKVKLHDSKFNTILSFDTGAGGARSVFLRDKTLVLGTNMCEMYYTRDYATSSKLEMIHTGHCDGELWAVAPHPDASSGIFASVGEDNRIITWQAIQHKAIKSAPITNDAATVARKIQRAATSTTFSTNQCARAISWSPNGNHFSVGTNEGKCAVFDSSSLSLIALVDLNSFGKANNKNPEHWIQCLCYSPNGEVLAVGTHGSVIVLLDVKDNYVAKEKLIAHNAAITSLDWSIDSKYIQSVCLGYELLFHEVVPGLKGSKQEKSASKLKNTQWASQSCKFGWFVNGIFRPGQEGFRINTVDRAPSRDVIATGEDTGKINLFRYPCNSEGNSFTSFVGHASHVTCVRFFPDDSTLVSAGGNDKCIFQWRIIRE